MEYNKPPLTVEEQAKLLIKRGLSGNLELIMSRLAAVNYYRLSGYWYPFRNPDDSFKPGTTFDNVWELYVFDRHLRLLVMDAIERIEISVRSQLAYNHSHTYGSFGYATQKAALPKFDDCRYNDCIRHVQKKPCAVKKHLLITSGRNTVIIMKCCRFGWLLKSCLLAPYLPSTEGLHIK